MRRAARWALGAARNASLASIAVLAAAHVGSPNVFFVGKAGAYDVTVIVRPPQVVPGLAEITVRIPPGQASEIRRVVVRPVFWATGTRGSPAGDVAERVATPEPAFTGKLWLMQGGSYSVYVDVEGARGAGTVTVPVAAVATRQLALTGALKGLLVVLGFVLFFGLLTIIRGAAGESLVTPGAELDAKRRRTSRLVTAIAFPVLLLLIFGGWRWWTNEADAYRRTLYRPLAVATTVTSDSGGGTRFRMEITDSAWLARRITAILPDHGKMMHLFLIADSTLDVLAHLHPPMVDSNTFETRLPGLPAGRYRVYGDIVHESGYERTLVSSVVVPASRASAPVADPDDAVAVRPVAATLGAADAKGAAVVAPSLRLLSSTTSPITWGQPVELRFQLVDTTGRGIAVEPYLGMPAHAVITRHDGSVFIHLHPMGTFSMASQQSFAIRDRGDTTARGRLREEALSAAMSHAMGAPDGRVGFVYEFPKAGSYRVWVQVKHEGRILTGAFDAEVQ